MASPSWIWNVSYMSVQDMDNGVRNLKDGEIQGWSSNWILLMDDKGIPITGRSIQQDVDEFKVGSVIEFSEFHALIAFLHPLRLILLFRIKSHLWV
jgi:hypothetical protein